MSQRDESTAALSIRTGDSFLSLGQHVSAHACYMTAVTEAAKPGANGNMDRSARLSSSYLIEQRSAIERLRRLFRIPTQSSYVAIL